MFSNQCFLFSPDIYPGMQLLNHTVVLFLEPSVPSAQWLQQFTLLPTVHKCTLFSMPLPTFVIFMPFMIYKIPFNILTHHYIKI